MFEDPWKAIDLQVSDGMINARRVSAARQWNLFWEIDAERRYLLVLRHRSHAVAKIQMPKIKGLEIVFVRSETDDPSVLLLRLLDQTQREIFYQLCLDVVNATERATSEEQAVLFFIRRAWRWHHLLKGGTDGLLTSEEQKGLLGEMLTIERHLMQSMSPKEIATAWTGPLDAPKDFEIGGVCVEVKARRGASNPYVAISSEHQLSTAGLEALFLHVV